MSHTTTTAAAVVLLLASSTSTVNGVGWGSSSCGTGRRHGHFHHGGGGRRHPYHGCRRKKHDAFDLISDILTLPVNSLLRQSAQHMERVAKSSPRYDIYEDEEGMLYQLTLEVPGVKAQDLSVEFDEDASVLRVSGTRHYRSFGTIQESKFERSFQLDPKEVKVDQLSVTLANGILTIQAPKRQAQSRKINIQEEFDDDDDDDNTDDPDKSKRKRNINGEIQLEAKRVKNKDKRSKAKTAKHDMEQQEHPFISDEEDMV